MSRHEMTLQQRLEAAAAIMRDAIEQVDMERRREAAGNLAIERANTAAAGELTPEPILYTTALAASMLGMAEQTLRNMRAEGEGPRFVRRGRAVRYRRVDLEAWAEAEFR